MSLKEELAQFDKPARACLTHAVRLTGYLREDALQEARMAYWQSGKSFDPSRHVTPVTKAAKRIHGAVADFWRGEDVLTRDQRAEVKAGEAIAPVTIPNSKILLSKISYLGQSPEAAAAGAEVHKLLLLARPDERNVLTRHYLEDEPIRAIAVDLGLSIRSVFQIKLFGLDRIRRGIVG